MHLLGKEYTTDEIKYICTSGWYLLQDRMAMVESRKDQGLPDGDRDRRYH